jgi:hypothetical protein
MLFFIDKNSSRSWENGFDFAFGNVMFLNPVPENEIDAGREAGKQFP